MSFAIHLFKTRKLNTLSQKFRVRCVQLPLSPLKILSDLQYISGYQTAVRYLDSKLHQWILVMVTYSTNIILIQNNVYTTGLFLYADVTL
jgi:hypothetical protein